nr:hypothetical protein RTCK_04059 [Rhizobium sp. TCK]
MSEMLKLAEKLKEAKEQFLRRDQEYEDIGSDLERRYKRHLSKYIDAEPPRAAEIREVAHTIDHGIRGFLEIQARLSQRVMMILLALNQRALDVHLKATAQIVGQFQERSVGEVTANDSATVAKETEAAIALALQAISLAASVYQIRVQLLRHFLGDSRDVVMADFIQAGFEEAAILATRTVMELVPGVAQAVKALEFLNNVSERLQKFELPYSGWSDVDDLFNARMSLEDQQASVEQIIAAIDAIFDLLAVKSQE